MKNDNRPQDAVEAMGKGFAAVGLSAPRVGLRSVSALESLKGMLLADQLAKVQDAELRRRLRWAADDSASLAWATPVPLLVLPELLTEKAREALRQFERQRLINANRRAPVELAA